MERYRASRAGRTQRTYDRFEPAQLGTVIMRRLDQRHRIPRKTGATETRASGKHALSIARPMMQPWMRNSPSRDGGRAQRR